MSTKSLNRHSLANQIYEILKDWILNLQYQPGDRIDTKYLENYFHVSHAPIRDALNHLIKDKLIIVKPRVGYFAVELTITDVERLWDVREMLEKHALEMTFHPVPYEELTAMKERMKAYKSGVYKKEVLSDLNSIDMDLHRGLIIGRSENTYIIEFYQSIYDLLTISMHITERYLNDIEEHMNIIESWMSDDFNATRTYLLTHLSRVKEKLILKLNEQKTEEMEGSG